MPDPDGLESDEEINQRIDAMAERWRSAPEADTFPPEETQRIKDDSQTIGWAMSPLGEVFLNTDYQFFSSLDPMYADGLNAIFSFGPLRYCPADGCPVRHLLSNAARWAHGTYFVKPEMDIPPVPGRVY